MTTQFGLSWRDIRYLEKHVLASVYENHNGV